MDHFQYRNGQLAAESVPLEQIAKEVGTPFYCYSSATLERHYRVFTEAFEGLNATICYAVKANSNLAVIATLARLGSGADVVSAGELDRALGAGVPAGKVVFSGVGKTEAELAAALEAGILQINVESEPELEALSRIASARGVKASVALRVNPDVNAKTHAKITTGLKENKFGIEWTRAREIYAYAASLPGIRVSGVAVHIGSQLTDLQPFRDTFTRLRDLTVALRRDGHDIDILDLGGGLGVPYHDQPVPSPAEYAQAVRDSLAGIGCRLVLEPGRAIAGNTGVLVTRVIYVKEGATRRFLIVDAAMNDLMRPALYDARHEILTLTQPSPETKAETVDVVGPICETGDTFATELALPPVAAGDLLAFRTAGAYGAVMASFYNSRNLAPEVLVSGKAFSVVRRRLEIKDVLKLESMPDWLQTP